MRSATTAFASPASLLAACRSRSTAMPPSRRPPSRPPRPRWRRPMAPSIPARSPRRSSVSPISPPSPARRRELALRIHRACHERGIKTVAVHSTADAAAMHVRLADETVCIGPPAARASYLNMPAILSAATISGADAIHPGLGFLAENADFAGLVEEQGFTFIGPCPEHIRLMADKIAAKAEAVRLGIPVVPGSSAAVRSIAEADDPARAIGYPVLLKAASGGGGRGMKLARDAVELHHTPPLAPAEARAGFGDDAIYLERCLDRPRHIEVQLIGACKGGGIHLGERDCSLQRAHQKLIEEAPSPHP